MKDLRPDLVRFGEFTLASGRKSAIKFDCDALTAGSWEAIAAWASTRLPSFGSVEGVPTGGLCLADALRPYATTGPLLVVDDVLTSGTSMERHRAGRPAVGFVFIARGPLPGWVSAMLHLDTVFR